MSDVLDRVKGFVQAGDRPAVLEVMAGLTEPDRLALAPHLRTFVERVREEHWVPGMSPGDRNRVHAAAVAEAATAPAQAVAGLWAVDLDVLELRPPAWRQAWVREWTAHRRVRPVYPAWRAGLVERPTGPDWVLGLLRGLPVETTLADAIAADPDLLERDVWELFETEGGGEDSLAAHDKYPPRHGTWAQALRSLADRGVLDRARLLDASLHALARDLPQFQAGWFTAFHEVLEPTPDERERRQAVYCRLLRSPIGPTVAFAVRALRVLRADGRLDDDVLQAHLGPALLARSKGTATAALALLEGCADPNPELARSAVDHPAADVQARAARLLARLGAGTDDAVLAPRLRDAPVDDGGPVPDLPPRRDIDPAAPRVLRKLEPVTDVDDLARRLTILTERLDDPDEMDLVVDAVVRWGPTPEVLAAVQPLARAAHRRLVDLPVAVPVSTVVRALVVALADPASPLVRGQVIRWLPWSEALERLAAGGPPPLWTPTHVGGWLDVDELAGRLRAAADPPAADVVAALRRVPPWQADQVARLRLPDHPDVARALAELGSPSTEYQVRRGKHGEVVVDGADERATGYDVGVRRKAHARPGRKEGHYASGVAALGTNRDWWEARWQERLFLEPLLDPDEPFGPMARLLVATALATKEPGQRRLAVDVVVQAVEDGRLDADALADGLTRAADWSAPARLVGTFEDAASAGPLQALVVRRAALAALPAHDPAARGLAPLLELLLDLATAAGASVEDPARAWLGRLTGSSKAARAARALLAVEGRGGEHQRAAVEQALRGRARPPADHQLSARAVSTEPGEGEP